MAAATRHLLLFIALAAYIWAIVLSLTDGFVLRTEWLTLSSRNPRGPLTIALVVSVWYAFQYRRHWPDDTARLVHAAWPKAIALAATLGALVAGVGWGTYIGGGPDASGYVSQADMWVRGVLTLEPPGWARDAPWPYGVWSSSPIGYGPNAANDAIVPMYSPGFPMMMAIFQVAGGARAVYYVVPILGAVSVWGAYLLGRRLSGEWAGAIAALLLVCSPAFLWMVAQPMSDVPVTACWTMALVFALGSRRRDAMAAGVAAALAILVRPNVVPLGLFPAALLLLADRRHVVQRLALYGLAPVLAAAVIAALNWYYNGSPLQSGYGSLAQIYEADRIPANFARYTTWLAGTQTPLVFAGLLAALLVTPGARRLRTALVTLGYPLTALALYLPYVVFDHWPFLRFLLPAYPALLAGVGTVLVEAPRRWNPLLALASVTLVAWAALHGWQVASRENTFQIATFDRRYARAVDFVNALPRNAVIVSNVHSGTLHFYTGRDVLRFEVMRPEDMDRAIAHLRERNHPVYFVGDPNEVEYFEDLFPTSRAIRHFDERPIADLNGVVIYEF